MNKNKQEIVRELSKEARQFLIEAGDDIELAVWEKLDLSKEGIQLARAENREAAEEGRTQVLSETGVIIKKDVINNVPVEWYVPPEIDGDEVVLYFFGGGFVVGGTEDDTGIIARVAGLLKRRVCAVSYGLSPENQFPFAIKQAKKVYDSFDERVVLFGESAGGNLAVNLALLNPEKPLAVALLSPWLDLTNTSDSCKNVKDPTLSCEHFLEPAADAYAGANRKDPKVSPIFAEFPSIFPPTIITTGTRDILLSDAVRLNAILKTRCSRVSLNIHEGLWHVFEWNVELPESLQSIKEVVHFLRGVLSNE